MTKKQKKVLIRIIVSAVLLVAMAVTFIVLDKTGMVNLENPSVMWRCIEIVAYLIPYLIIGYDILTALQVWLMSIYVTCIHTICNGWRHGAR